MPAVVRPTKYTLKEIKGILGEGLTMKHEGIYGDENT